MPLAAHYTPIGIFYNGSETNHDGTVTMTREIPLTFQRNRFCNPVGRLIGPKGSTVKWLRRETGCTITVHTNDVRARYDTKVTIKACAPERKVMEKMEYALSLILPIIDPNNRNNIHMSDFQLFRRGTAETAEIHWIPEAFNAVNSGPNANEMPVPPTRQNRSVPEFAPHFSAMNPGLPMFYGNGYGVPIPNLACRVPFPDQPSSIPKQYYGTYFPRQY